MTKMTKLYKMLQKKAVEKLPDPAWDIFMSNIYLISHCVPIYLYSRREGLEGL